MESYGDKEHIFDEVSELHKNSIDAAVQRTRKMLTGWKMKTKRFRPQNIQGMFTASTFCFIYYFQHEFVTNSVF